LFSRCAGEQGRFWEALDWLFSLPELEGYLSPAELRQTMLTRGAQGLELDPEGLAECMDSPRQVKKIQDDIAVADKLGLESTPAFWINGKRFPKPTVEGLKMVFSSILGAE
jgi:protein-disulfide isomerase